MVNRTANLKGFTLKITELIKSELVGFFFFQENFEVISSNFTLQITCIFHLAVLLCFCECSTDESQW